MALYKYFKKNSVLPNPDGPLSTRVPPSAIAEANKQVQPLIENDSASKKSGKRGQYLVYTDEEKCKIGKRAAEMGVTSTLRFYQKEFADRPLKESTVRTWATKYKIEMAQRSRFGKEMEIAKLESAKRGPPLLLGKELDMQVQEYVKNLRDNGGVVNSAIVIAGAEGIIKSHDSNLLKENGGHIACSKSWAKSFLGRLGYVKRRVSTKAKVTVADFDAYKAQFIFDIQAIVELEEIPPDLIINWDHTGIHYVPVSNWTLAKEGSKRIEIAGSDDKRQITVQSLGNFCLHRLYMQARQRNVFPLLNSQTIGT